MISAYGADEYNSDFHAACPENSVTTLVITSAEAANDPFVVDKIRNAHAIFLSGGDQSHYVNYWTGQAVQREINADVARGVPLGGISAGLAVQGQFVFTAMLDTVKSPEALANPYDPHVTLVRDFLSIPVLKGVITDSHFSQRERMGRSLAFLARIVQDGWANGGARDRRRRNNRGPGRSRWPRQSSRKKLSLLHDPRSPAGSLRRRTTSHRAPRKSHKAQRRRQFRPENVDCNRRHRLRSKRSGRQIDAQ